MRDQMGRAKTVCAPRAPFVPSRPGFFTAEGAEVRRGNQEKFMLLFLLLLEKVGCAARCVFRS